MINRFNEFETCEQVEMAYIKELGFPYKLDKSNPKKVVMIVRSDAEHIASLVNGMWEGDELSHKFLQHFNVIKELKRELWVGGVYDKDYYAKEKQNANNNNRTPDQQKKQ